MGARSTSRFVAIAGGGGVVALVVLLALTRSSDDRDEHVSSGAPGVHAAQGERVERVEPVERAPATEAHNPRAARAETALAVPEIAPVAGDERRAVPLGRRGRVATADGAGVAGVELVVRFAGSERARALTGSNGEYAFAAAAEADAGFLRPYKEGWRFEPWRVGLRSVEPDAAVDFRAEAVDLVPFRARVIDRLTGEPVPRLGVRVQRSPFVDVVATSDDAGALYLEAELEPGRLDVTFLGGSYLSAERRVDLRPAEEVVLEVDVGPTYDLALDLFDGVSLDDLEAVLVPAPHAAARAVARALECGAPLPEQWDEALFGAAADAIAAPLRADGPRHGGPWVRFERLLPDRALPRRLDGGYELLVEGKGFAGRAAVPRLVGVCPGVVHVTLAPLGAVVGRVTYPRRARDPAVPAALGASDVRVWTRSEPSPSRPWITLRSVATGAERAAAADSDGAFAFHGVEPGDYELTSESARAGAAVQRVTVPAVSDGEPVEVDVRLPYHPDAVFALGLLMSRSGAYTGPATVELVSVSDPARRFRVTAELGGWARSAVPVTLVQADGAPTGGLAAVFALRGVPPGSYALSVRSPEGFAWTPSSVLLAGPESELLFTCEDRVDTAVLKFDLRDAATDEPIGGDGYAWIDAGGGIVEGYPRRVPRTASGRFIAVSHDHAPALGRWSADPESDVVRIEARLARGPGLAVLAVTPWGEPVAGAEIVVDGAPLGRTDAGGLLHVVGRTAERSIDARLPGWVAVPGYSGIAEVTELGMALVVLVRN